MTREENVLWARRMIVDSIWKGANLEGIPVTFPETQVIYDGLIPQGYTVNQITTINNLKHAWEFILKNIDAPFDLEIIRGIHRKVGASEIVLDPGQLREQEVIVTGTEWTPAKPNLEDVCLQIERIAHIDNPTEQALDAFATICRGQWFNDGNKRAAQLTANFLLIRAGAGLFSIPVTEPAKQVAFITKLISYYETGDSISLKQWLYNNALSGTGGVI